MKPIEQAKLLIHNKEIQEASKNLLEDAVSAAFGDPTSIAKIVIALGKSPFFIREQLFWSKFEAFLNGVFLEETDIEKMKARLSSIGKKEENGRHLIDIIDRTDTMDKINYQINTARCLLSGLIDLPTFFKLCHAISQTMAEDLVFLKNHITEHNLPYNLSVQGLLSSGLMNQTAIENNEEQRFSFNQLAKLVYKYSLACDDADDASKLSVCSGADDKLRLEIKPNQWGTF